MPTTLPIEVYEVFENSFGKEGAHKVVKSLEAAISDATDYKWKTTKDELLDVMRREFVTRELFEERFALFEEKLASFDGKLASFDGKLGSLKAELEGKMDTLKVALEGRLEIKIAGLEGSLNAFKAEVDGRFDKMNQKFNFMIILIIIALTLMNPVVAEIIKGLLKL